MVWRGVLDNVGGQQLAEAFSLLEPGGVALSIGKASGQPTTIDFEAERHRSGDRRIEPFVIGSGLAEVIGYLVRLLDRGELDPQIGWRGPWERAPEVAEALLSRRVAGKAVLDVPAERAARRRPSRGSTSRGSRERERGTRCQWS
ncbi:zinc-binding dehydrogenase [Pseudofrankia sp. BMG5.36]|uniref:zinc-binding dehydrogenase n=1 Tax=Pseudofrankia sp. BMG5.36 TaxID=1834512 RepID=UPI000A8560FF|nr:zinc-binding dehydrogenase [Pseudofrankia sp. BMG5.36]